MNTSADKDFWVFGYGSLIFRPNIPFKERIVGKVTGYERRFWQASTDHRGTPESPGRVVTLVERAGSECWGVAYQVPAESREEVLSTLDHREKGGYSLIELPFHPHPGSPAPKNVSVYIGHTENEFFVGEEDEAQSADIIRSACGPSGHNIEYIVKLTEALDELGITDPNVLNVFNLVIDPSGVLDE